MARARLLLRDAHSRVGSVRAEGLTSLTASTLHRPPTSQPSTQGLRAPVSELRVLLTHTFLLPPRARSHAATTDICVGRRRVGARAAAQHAGGGGGARGTLRKGWRLLREQGGL